MSYPILFLIISELGIHVFEDVLWAKILFMVCGGISFGILCSRERSMKKRIAQLESATIFMRDAICSFQEKNNSIFEKIADILTYR